MSKLTEHSPLGPSLDDYRAAYTALESILWARVKMGETFKGNPYLDSRIKAGLKAVAEIRGVDDYLDALDGGEHV